MSSVKQEEVLNDIAKRPCFSVLVDESSDIHNRKYMAVAVKYVKEGVSKISFVEGKQINDGKADTIFSELIPVIENCGDFKKMCSFTSDGGSAMVGKYEGVVAKSSCTRTSTLVTVQNVLCAAKGTTIKRAGFTRWLSHGNELNSIRKNYAAILTDLENAVASGEGASVTTGPTASGLLKNYKDFDFFYMIHFIWDVLDVLDKLDLLFQKSEIDIKSIQINVEGTIFSLKKLKKKPGGTFCRSIEDRARQLGINAPTEAGNGSFPKHAKNFLPYLIKKFGRASGKSIYNYLIRKLLLYHILAEFSLTIQLLRLSSS
ncbi:unnamed protein product [Larinioides sclopetarius]|uniref:DUF4371 domain-containing protein n=1 Tax=Larinioides sclopetarius TaxID=280406 RepID=A0AAV2B2P4_9ARAC